MTVTDAEFAALLCEHMPIDPGIVRAVRVLQEAGLETFESCEGGDGHCFPEPTVRFHGEGESIWRALAACLEEGLPVLAVRRAWSIVNGEPSGPYGEVVFRQKLA